MKTGLGCSQHLSRYHSSHLGGWCPEVPVPIRVQGAPLALSTMPSKHSGHGSMTQTRTGTDRCEEEEKPE